MKEDASVQQSGFDEMTEEAKIYMIVRMLTVCDNPSGVQMSRHFVKLPGCLRPEQSSLNDDALLQMREGLSVTAFRSSCQTALCCVLLRKRVVSDKEKREQRFLQVRIQ